MTYICPYFNFSKNRFMKKWILTLIAFVLCAYAMPQEEARLLRFPAVYGNQVVFSYAGDLYTVPATGGMARKLTNDENGYEMFARFSPDGKQIAFTGQYDGNTEVFVIPAEGGIPKRLTFTATLGRDDISDRMGPNNIVMTWKDNKTVVFRSRKQTFNDFKGQLFLANTDGGLAAELPFPAGGFCSYSPDGSKLAYNRVFREFRTWKYYRGGQADDIWIYDFQTKQIENITNNKAQDIMPMWKGDKIFFCSDRDRTMNIFVYDLKTKETRKVTQFTQYDVKFPSLGDKYIAFENGGYIYLLDLATEKAEKMTIRIADDFISGRDMMKDASKSIGTFSVSPDGKRISFGARGDVWTVPAKTGITRNLTSTSGIHERDVAWSPDGQYIAYVSDKTGEDEIYISRQDGTGEPVQLTKNADTYKYAVSWSPDSKKLLWSDKMLRLQYVDIDTKEVKVVTTSKDWEYRDFSWSPDSKWITYTEPVSRGSSRIYLYELATGKKFPATDEWYDCSGPVFSSDGKYILFASNRDYNPTYGTMEWNHVFNDMTKVYMIPLAKATPNPFRPENDEVKVAKEEPAPTTTGKTKKSASEEKKEEASAQVTVKVDQDGIMDRVIALPVEAGNYWNISAVDDEVYYVKNGKNDDGPSLMVFNLKDQKESPVGNFGTYEISADHKKMLVAMGGKFGVIDLPKGKTEVRDFADLSNMKVKVDLQAEWNQIYQEAWRQMKYFFYAPNMHGVDWNAMKDKYGALLPYVNNRNDLNYLIGELIGELNVGHAYVGGGDKPAPERIKQGLLGAQLSRDASGYYCIDKILKGENWAKSSRSPLTEIGVDVKEGDYIIAVNGKPTKNMTDIYESLVNTAGDQVELTVNGTPSEANARKTIVVPIDNESQLYYYTWVQDNIRKVNEATNGEVGYIHIPDMSSEGLVEFAKHFYPQLSKKALIIDDRGNGGGNVSPMIIERLAREAVIMKMSRNTGQTAGNLEMVLGPKICLIDQYSASDGDLFPYQFRAWKLGKLVGVRTWGGVVGIRGSLPFIDGGSLNKPEFAHYDYKEDKWAIEGEGVTPDVWVDNDPAKEYAGEDQQLNKAIELIKEELKSWPKELPAIPPFPDKTK